MIVCVCYRIKEKDIESLSSIELETLLRQKKYKERCEGCLEGLKNLTKESKGEVC